MALPDPIFINAYNDLCGGDDCVRTTCPNGKGLSNVVLAVCDKATGGWISYWPKQVGVVVDGGEGGVAARVVRMPSYAEPQTHPPPPIQPTGIPVHD